jgi:serine/threonine protein kinase
MMFRIESSHAKDLTPFQDVRLGPLVGKGSFGKVYRGIWDNVIVAIKVSLLQMSMINMLLLMRITFELCAACCAKSMLRRSDTRSEVRLLLHNPQCMSSYHLLVVLINNLRAVESVSYWGQGLISTHIPRWHSVDWLRCHSCGSLRWLCITTP